MQKKYVNGVLYEIRSGFDLKAWFDLKAISSLLLLLTLSGCSQLQPEANAQAGKINAPEAELEPVYGFEVLPSFFRFTVKSAGCSHPTHFSVEVTEIKTGMYSVSLLRNKTDNCRAIPRLFPVQMPIKQDIENNAQIQLNNPFAIKNNLRAHKSG